MIGPIICAKYNNHDDVSLYCDLTEDYIERFRTGLKNEKIIAEKNSEWMRVAVLIFYSQFEVGERVPCHVLEDALKSCQV